MSMSTRSAYDLDLRDVRGQIGPRRALEIAAAGGHNILMIGPPGCGKTMLAVRLPALLPAADGDTECPFRAPHHTASAMEMLDGAGEPNPRITPRHEPRAARTTRCRTQRRGQETPWTTPTPMRHSATDGGATAHSR